MSNHTDRDQTDADQSSRDQVGWGDTEPAGAHEETAHHEEATRHLEPAPITVTDLSLSFGDLRVLEDASLSIEPGEFVGFVGPNGAGKTTLLRAISGAITPDSGTVTIDDTDVHAVSSRASSRLVAVVPQDTSLSFSFPVRDVVEMGRHPHRSRFAAPTHEDRDAVERALERTRTTELAERPIDEVSGGQRQRVVLARAIAQETPALLLDEPTASLDVNHQIETLELVRELVDSGRTAVAAIHDLDLAARYCDRLVLLADGAVHDVGTPDEVLTADALAEAFDANATVTTNPVTGTETVTALPDAAAVSDTGGGQSGDSAARIHVLGTGTTAASAVARLATAGYEVSVGPVTPGDAAAETAARLSEESPPESDDSNRAVETVTVEPFAPLSADDRAELESHIRQADSTVFADLTLTAGNQLVLDPLESVEQPILVETTPLAERNGAGAAARERYEACRERGVEVGLADLLDGVEGVLSGSGVGTVEVNSSSPAVEVDGADGADRADRADGVDRLNGADKADEADGADEANEADDRDDAVPESPMSRDASDD
ncbi:ATP-binding cassette domain-containing protein [Natrialba sp. SSL1]|uniref:ATP-binding cassette domain-containing protein n=1 Tax=Natrialba sp. SSL1 TaxID=1869245 RepID=UPI0008F8723B|nr:ATP-binding cassette domain-containing protein [Natrialba sp. SSL1]OIB58007.1 ABC transporter [Natrialba sp. SSL1]